MRYLVIALLLIIGCKQENTPVEVTVNNTETKEAVTLELKSQSLYTVNTTQYYSSTFVLTNNSGKTIDSAKVTITGAIVPYSNTFKVIQSKDVNYISVTSQISAQLKTNVQWW